MFATAAIASRCRAMSPSLAWTAFSVSVSDRWPVTVRAYRLRPNGSLGGGGGASLQYGAAVPAHPYLPVVRADHLVDRQVYQLLGRRVEQPQLRLGRPWHAALEGRRAGGHKLV